MDVCVQKYIPVRRKRSNHKDWVLRRERKEVREELDITKPHVGSYLGATGHLLTAIEESKTILELEEDWDDEGAPAYTSEVLARAHGFLMRQARRL